MGKYLMVSCLGNNTLALSVFDKEYDDRNYELYASNKHLVYVSKQLLVVICRWHSFQFDLLLHLEEWFELNFEKISMK